MFYYKCITDSEATIWQEIDDVGGSQLLDAQGVVIFDTAALGGITVISIDQAAWVTELLPAVTMRKLAELSAAYELAMTSGFRSSALGFECVYATDDDRKAMLSAASARALNGKSQRFYCTVVETGIGNLFAHTPAQMLQVLDDAAASAEGYMDNLRSKISQVQASQTIIDAENVSW